MYIFRDVNIEAMFWALVKKTFSLVTIICRTENQSLSELESYCKEKIHLSVFVLILYQCTL